LSILIISHTTRCISQKKLAATLFGCLFIFASPVKKLEQLGEEDISKYIF
jgi:hypothetical protein